MCGPEEPTIQNQERTSTLRPIIQSPSVPNGYREPRWFATARPVKHITPIQAVQMIYIFIELNILISITNVTVYTIFLNMYEIRLSSSIEILYDAVGFMLACVIKIIQCFLCLNSITLERTERLIKYCFVNLLFSIPIILLIWFSMNCADMYRTRLSIKMNDHHIIESNTEIMNVNTNLMPYQRISEDFVIRAYETNTVYKTAWDQVQSTYKCCGLNGYNDWKRVGVTLPHSCCPVNFTTNYVPAVKCDAAKVHAKGCFPIINNILLDSVDQITFFTMKFLLPVEVINIIFLLCWLVTVTIKRELKARYRPVQSPVTSYSVDLNMILRNVRQQNTEPPPSYNTAV